MLISINDLHSRRTFCEGTAGDGSIIRSLMHSVWFGDMACATYGAPTAFPEPASLESANSLARSRRTHQECELLPKHLSHTLPLRYAAWSATNLPAHITHLPLPGACSRSGWQTTTQTRGISVDTLSVLTGVQLKHVTNLTNDVYDVSNPERATGPVMPE